MELKKSKEADLERKKVVFTTVGLMIVSAMVLMAFTYQDVTVGEKVIVENKKKKVEDDLLFDVPPPPPPPPVEQQQAPPPPDLEEIKVVEDDKIVEEIKFDDPIDEPPPPSEEVKIVEEEIHDFVDQDPLFPGGEAEMQRFIQKNVVYPELSRDMGEQGTVYVRFVVNTDGSIQDVEVVKGVSSGLDKEAVRVVKQMPKWTPGEQAGKAVRVRFMVPIKFTIA